MANFKNYRTTKLASETIDQIQTLLVEHGAERIEFSYKAKRPVGIAFSVNTQFGPRRFALPANVENIERVLRHQADAGQIAQRYATPERARDVAWRVLYDWLAAQMALIEAELVSLEQVLLPYLLLTDGRTVFDAVQAARFDLPQLESPKVIPLSERASR